MPREPISSKGLFERIAEKVLKVPPTAAGETAMADAQGKKTERKYLSMDSKMIAKDKKENMISFRKPEERTWMSNPLMLAVGIDLPQMQGVSIMSSMSSPVNIAQLPGPL